MKGLRGLGPGRDAHRASAGRVARAARHRAQPAARLDSRRFALREIVLRAPHTPQALAAIAGMPPAFVQNCGDEVCALVGAAATQYPPAAQPRRERPDPEQLARVKRLSAILQAVAAELGLSPEILATRRDLERLAAGERDLAPLSGWRCDAIGQRLLTGL